MSPNSKLNVTQWNYGSEYKLFILIKFCEDDLLIIDIISTKFHEKIICLAFELDLIGRNWTDSVMERSQVRHILNHH